jgi:hypothetical protein
VIGSLSVLRYLLSLRIRMVLRPDDFSSRQTIRQWRKLLTKAAVLFGVGLVLAYVLGGLFAQVLSGANSTLLLGPMLGWISSSTALLIFLAAIPMILATFTYDGDLRTLLLSPLPPALIMTEKCIWLIVTIMIPLLTVGLILLASLSRATATDAAYGVLAIPALVVMPVVPVALAMVLTVSVLRWVPPARVRTITSLISAALGIGVFALTQVLDSHTAGHDAQDLKSLFTGSSTSWWADLPSAWPGRALAAGAQNHMGTALAYLAATAALGGILGAVAVITAARLFATGWATYQEVGGRHATHDQRWRSRNKARVGAAAENADAADPATFAARAAPSSLLRSADPGIDTWREPGIWPLIAKEWHLLRRDPQVWSRYLYPLFILAFSVYQGLVLGTQQHTGSYSVIGTGLFIYVLILLIAPPVINREGRALALLALAPIDTHSIVFAKWFFCAAPAVAIVEAALLTEAVVLRIAVDDAILIALSFGALVVTLTGVMIAISLIWPRLDWDSPARQVSGTARVVGLLAGAALSGVVYALLVAGLVWQENGISAAAAACWIAIFAILVPIAIVTAVLAPRRLDALMHGEG